MSVTFDLDNDPLITPYDGGLTGWASRIWGVLQRSGPLLLRIFAITHVLPTAVCYLLIVGDVLSTPWARRTQDDALDPAGMLIRGPIAETKLLIGPLLALAFAVLVLVVVPHLIGYGAATYAATRAAAGLRSTTRQALRYGLRRAAGLTAWMLLAGLMVGLLSGVAVLCGSATLTLLGLPRPEATRLAGVLALGVACFTATFAAFTGPSLLFERGFAVRRSFELVADRWGWVGLQLLPVAVPIVGGPLLIRILAGLPAAALDGGPGLLVGVVTGFTVLLGVVIAAAWATFAFSTLLVTYGRLRRIDQTTLTTANLVNELDGRYGVSALPAVAA
jgi:hypothetical protein